MSLTLSDTFVQVDTRKGYRFLDNAGLVMNHYDDTYPGKNVNPNGLQLTNGPEPLTEMNITSEKVWFHFSNPGTLTLAVEQSRHHMQQICRMLEVSSAKRFGVRSQWLHAAKSLSAAQLMIQEYVFRPPLSSLFDGKTTASCELKWSLQDDLTVTLRLSAGVRSESAPPIIPESMVVIDLDIGSDNKDLARPLSQFRTFTHKAEELTKRTVQEVDRALGALV